MAYIKWRDSQETSIVLRIYKCHTCGSKFDFTSPSSSTFWSQSAKSFANLEIQLAILSLLRLSTSLCVALRLASL